MRAPPRRLQGHGARQEDRRAAGIGWRVDPRIKARRHGRRERGREVESRSEACLPVVTGHEGRRNEREGRDNAQGQRIAPAQARITGRGFEPVEQRAGAGLMRLPHGDGDRIGAGRWLIGQSRQRAMHVGSREIEPLFHLGKAGQAEFQQRKRENGEGHRECAGEQRAAQRFEHGRPASPGEGHEQQRNGKWANEQRREPFHEQRKGRAVEPQAEGRREASAPSARVRSSRIRSFGFGIAAPSLAPMREASTFGRFGQCT